MNGYAQIFLNPNRENSGEQWLWSYFEPDTGLNPGSVDLLWGDLNLPLDQYSIQTKSIQSGYNIHDKIAERKQHGYTLLPALPADDLEVVKTLIATWQAVLYRKEFVLVAPELLKIARKGISICGGDQLLASDRPRELGPLRLLVTKTTVPSRYNW